MCTNLSFLFFWAGVGGQGSSLTWWPPGFIFCSLASEGLESPKSDSELELRALEPSSLRAESYMQWAWGRLPKVRTCSSTPILALEWLCSLHRLRLE